MGQFGLAAARIGEMIVYGAQRPGYSAEAVEPARVSEWISFMKQSGLHRVCCLLPPNQLAYYRVDLLARYREAFGEPNVCHVEIEDYHLCGPGVLESKILPFLRESDQASTPVVVHCSGGSGRTGHVLAAWLVRHRGLSVDDALAAVISSGRNPWRRYGAEMPRRNSCVAFSRMRVFSVPANPAVERTAGSHALAAAAHRERSAVEIARVTKVNGGHKLGPDLRATN